MNVVVNLSDEVTISGPVHLVQPYLESLSMPLPEALVPALARHKIAVEAEKKRVAEEDENRPKPEPEPAPAKGPKKHEKT